MTAEATTYDHLVQVVCADWELSATLMARATKNGMATTLPTWGRASRRAESLGKIERRKIGGRMEFRRAANQPATETSKGGRPRKDPQIDCVVEALELPIGTTHVTANGRDWHRPADAPDKVKYARTHGGGHFRRVRPQDISGPTQKRWLPVTAAHIDHMGKERMFG